MQKARILIVLAFVLLPFPTKANLVQVTDDLAKQPDILVDDNKVQCPTAQFTSIQAAVTAANPGDFIRVCAGNYPEQVVINKSLRIEADNGVVVMPGNVVANSGGSSTSEPIAAIFLVQNANDVKIKGFIVDGSANGIADCSPRLIGILYQDASGTVAHNAVRHIKLSPAFPGCQSGNAIEVESTGSSEANVTINDNSVDNYQKNGITANEPGTQVVISNNAVTGIGPTTGAAQNGIQIGFGAHGSVVGNSVADNVYSPCVSAADCPANAAGILIFQSDGITVARNTTATNQVGILIAANNSNVRMNTVLNSIALDGIALAGNGSVVDSNDVSHSDEAAVFIQGDNNIISNNEFTGASFGILKISGSTGNHHFGNQYFATLILVHDPAPQRKFTPMPSR
jgi:Periplasmic copper-binding protein (NosD)